MCQFKGPDAIEDPDGHAEDIKSYQWGYQWTVDVCGPNDVDYAFKLLNDAYNREK